MTKQMVILAAGQGTRMGGEVPKVLVPLVGRPMITYLLDEVAKLEDFLPPVIVVGYKNTQVEEALGKKYTYALQKEQLGTAHALWAAQKKVRGDCILVAYGDMPLITHASLQRIAKSHIERGAVLSMFTTHVPSYDGWYSDFVGFGRIIRNKYNEVVAIRENADASEQEKKIREVNPGIYMFKTQWLWDNIASISPNNALHQFYLTDMIAVAIAGGHAINDLSVDPAEVWGINTPAQLLQAESLMAQM